VRRRIETDDRVFLHFHNCEPKLLVVTDKVLAETYDWSPVRMPVVAIDEELIEYESWHPMLHALLENDCKGEFTRKPYRTKRGSTYGRMIRHGHKGESNGDIRGCRDTPMFDVDAIEVEDGKVVALVELKHRHERMTKAQRLVIGFCRDEGIDYIEDEHA
jgi:hypothetical protein